MKHFSFAAVAATLLTACGGTSVGGGVLSSSSASVIEVPTPPTPPDGLSPTNVVSSDGGGFTFGVLSDGFSSAQGYAQLLPVTVAAPPTTGSAVLEGTYSLSMVPLNPGFTTRQPVEVDAAPITLAVDFADGTLTGTDGDFSVDGTVSDGLLSGSVTFMGMSGEQLSGVVGRDRATGTFIGTAPDQILAGGFDVSN